MNSFAFLVLLVLLLATLVFTIVCDGGSHLSGTIMGLLAVLASVLSVGLMGGKGRDRSDR